MKLPRRRFFHLAAGAAALPAVPRVARADTYPSRPVRIIVGFPSGVAPDIQARLIAQSLSERLGHQFIVDNRPGAGTNIAAEAVARASPDGYTLLLSSSSNTVNAGTYDNLNFDFIRDLAPVAIIAMIPFVMVVTPSLPVKTISDFIAYAKANPSKINMASPGIGTTTHVFGELFRMLTGVEWVHVPYRGSFFPDLLAGQVQVSFTTIAGSLGYIKDGKLRALAVTTAVRSVVLPDVPAMGEFVPGYEGSGWNGISSPKGTSTEIIEKLNDAINSIVADPKIKERLADLGSVSMTMSPAEFGKFIADDAVKWAKVIKFANIKPE
jgi:tripartite-type tricarboxylate transporter receptor subunit TctC